MKKRLIPAHHFIKLWHLKYKAIKVKKKSTFTEGYGKKIGQEIGVTN